MQSSNFYVALRQVVKAHLGTLLRTLSLLWNASGKVSLLWLCLLVVQGVMPPLSLYLVRKLVDGLVSAIGSGGAWPALQPTLITAGALAGLIVLGELLRSASDWVNVAQSESIADHVRTLIQTQSTQIDLAHFELPEYYDRLARARDQAGLRPLSLLQHLGNLLRDGIALAGVGLILLHYGVWLSVALFLSTLPAFLSVIHYNRRHHAWWTETTAQRRWADYFDSALTQDQGAAELRLFGLGHHFQRLHQQIRQQLRAELLALTRAQVLARLATQLLVVGSFVGLMGWMAWRALRGTGTLGDVALLFQAFNQAQGLVGSLLRTIASIYRDSLYLSELFAFLDLTPAVADPAFPQTAPEALQEAIRLEQITFRYPGSTTPALNKLSLTIPRGQIVAVVGENGSGKSTLVKLLCRFYDPDAGRILLDGQDLRQLALSDLRRLLTVIFQHPVRYHATVAQNISYGDLQQPLSLEEIHTVADQAGAQALVAQLPEQYDTLLGKLFATGHELSSGEWQRLALARAFWRQAPIMLLDEPTSALDSWSEVDWFERLRRLAADKTVLLITHRFTLAKDADLIYVIEEGHVVEAGTHDELLRRGGRYAEAWHAQVQKTSPLAPTGVGANSNLIKYETVGTSHA